MNKRLVFLMVINLSLIAWISQAKAAKDTYYRNFWYPTYHIQPLSYCTQDDHHCGLPIANHYCKILGYDKAAQFIKANNVGISNYIELKYTGTQERCIGWKCHGFKLIRCEKLLKHPLVADYYYRMRLFSLPRANHYRVSWCYEGSKYCGLRAANSFCRRMGFAKSTSYSKDDKIFATKTLGDEALCFGHHCPGFQSITCFR
jgi:hypothetical protein